MSQDTKRHRRRSVRLPGYDYAQAGAYFVTVCSHDRICIFGEVGQGEMRPNVFGDIVTKCWHDLANHYSNIELDEFVVMPNHVHGIIVLADTVGAGFKPAPTNRPVRRHGLQEIVRAFKTFSARRFNGMRNTPGKRLWQRSYYEHVVQNDDDLDRTRLYIHDNAAGWHEDAENLASWKPAA